MTKDFMYYLDYLLQNVYNNSQNGILSFEEIYGYQDEIASRIYEIITQIKNKESD